MRFLSKCGPQDGDGIKQRKKWVNSLHCFNPTIPYMSNHATRDSPFEVPRDENVDGFYIASEIGSDSVSYLDLPPHSSR